MAGIWFTQPASGAGRSPLVPCGFAVPGDHAGWDASALLDVKAVLPRPGANSHGVVGTWLATCAGGGTAPTAADLAGVGNVGLQGIAQLVTVLGAEVDFVLGAVQGEADGALGLAAVDVVDEHCLDLLGHGMLHVSDGGLGEA